MKLSSLFELPLIQEFRLSNSDSLPRRTTTTTKVVVATTVMLSFISFWRAAAIVLADLASSAYYVGGIAETAIGKSAPWFILGIMLFSYAVRAAYIESCSMFVRGGVYRVVREAMGGTLREILRLGIVVRLHPHRTHQRGSAGLYLAGLINKSIDYFHLRYARPIRRISPPASPSVVTSISGAKTSSAFTNPARKLCASCRSQP